MRSQPVSVPQQGKRSFGADDNPICPACGGTMSLIRRGPHPEHGDGFESQIFECRKCRHEIIRSADKAGDPHSV
jgi:hypothetical protein